jgi:hypothetical protein
MTSENAQQCVKQESILQMTIKRTHIIKQI